MMRNTSTSLAAISEPITDVLDRLVAFLPNLIAAVALVVLGFVAAYLLRSVCRRIIVYALNRLKRDTSVTDGVQHHQLYQALPSIFSGLVFWIVLLFFLAAGIEALGLESVSGLFSSMTIYLPRLLAVAIIIFVGFVFGDFVRVWVTRVAARSGSSIDETLGRAAQIAIWLVAVLMSIDQLGIDSSVIVVTLAIVGGSMFGAGALAFGLGARTTVSNIIAAHYVHKAYHVGNTVKIGELQGEIIEVSRVAVVLDTPAGRVLVPASRFSEQASVLIEEGN